MRLVEPDSEELALLRPDPLLWEQELDVRPEVAADLERAAGRRSGEIFWRSGHDHLYSLELADLGRPVPAMARVFGWWERYEPRPPEHEIDNDLTELCLWMARVVDSLDEDDVRRVFGYARPKTGWPEGSVLRTPEERFTDLPDFPWQPAYQEVEGLRVAYIEAGPAGAVETMVLLHGEPTWSYLYRHMIPVLAEGSRVIVPDLVGFGRSDKPVAARGYRYRSHVRWLTKLVEGLDLREITLVCQDWGGLLGLRVVARAPQRFRRLVPMNTGLPDGRGPVADAFHQWREMSQRVRELDVAALMKQAVRRDGFSEAEALAYAAPFPGRDYQTGALVFPRLVPTRLDHPGAYENRKARAVLRDLDCPVLPVWSDGDPITAPWEADLRGLFRNVEATVRIAGAGHFLQEDAGVEIAERISAWMEGS